LVELHGRPAGVDISTIGDDVWNGEVSIQLAWDEKAKNAFVRRYSVSLNGEHLLDIESTGLDKLVFPTNVNPAHSLFRWPEGSEDEVGIGSYGVLDGLLGDFQQTAVAVYHLSAEYSVDELPTPEDDGYVVLLENPPASDIVEVRLLIPHHEFENLPQELQETFEEIASYAPELTEIELYFARYANGMIRLAALRVLTPFDVEVEDAKEEADRLVEEWFGKMNEPVSMVSIVSLSDALPSWHEPLRFKFLLADNPQFASMAPRFRLATELLNRLVVVPGRILARELRRFRHIGPLRRTPNRAYRKSTFSDRHSWSDGLAAWDALLRSKTLTETVSSWIHRQDRLALGYEIDFQEFREVPLESPISRCLTDSESVDLDTLQLAAELFEELPVRTRLQFRLDSSQVGLEPQDLAIGLNQLLPVVVAALDQHRGLTLIEQPELHNHPSVEVGLGDLFAQTIRDKSCQFLLETHGEHLLLRMLRRIRETSEGELPEGILPLEPDSIAIYFIGKESGSVSAKRLRIDETGEFIDKWPGGFFRERAGELF
jgi:hypothetical protein